MTEKTTDFDVWLDNVDPVLEDHDDVFSLCNAIVTCTSENPEQDYGEFKCILKNGKKTVTCSNYEVQLILVSDEAEICFIGIVEKRYCGEDMTYLAWYDYCRQMAKPD